MRTASARAEFKALPTDSGTGGEGRVTALVSVFDNVDYGGDRMRPGAFTATLAEWQSSGDPIPFIWAHQWNDPDAHIGVVTAARETSAGLEVEAQLDLDRPFAAQVWHLLKNRRVREFSFGFEVMAHEWTTVPAATAPTVTDADAEPAEGQLETEGIPGDLVRDITAVRLFECGPCLLGMNPATQLIDAASVPEPTAIAEAIITAEDIANAEIVDLDEDPDDADEPGSRDDASMIEITARLSDLLTKTRHSEG